LKRRSLILFAAGAPFVAGAAQAQNKVVRIVVGYPPGGPTDALARIIGQALGGALGQTAVVENRAGGMAVIASQLVKQAAPDGQTLLLCTNQSHATNPTLLKNPGYDPVKDFSAIAGLADIQQVLVIRKGLPVNSVPELVAYARANPGKLNYASTGVGAGAHLAMEMFKQRTGTDLVHVPFKGGAEMTQEIVAGRIDATFATLPSVLGQIRAGTMIPLALASDTPAPQLPTLPLLKNQGVLGCEADSWLGLVGPAGMPRELVDRYSRTVTDILAKPDVREAIVRAGMVVRPRDSAAFGAYIEEEIKRWAAVIRTANIRIDNQ